MQLQGARGVSWARSTILHRAWPQLCRKAVPSSSDMNQVWVLYFLLSQRKVSLWLRRAIARRARLFQLFILGEINERDVKELRRALSFCPMLCA